MNAGNKENSNEHELSFTGQATSDVASQSAKTEVAPQQLPPSRPGKPPLFFGTGQLINL